MGKQKTNKTAKKRIKLSNPKGNRKPKVLVNKSRKHHLQTKKSSRTKRRKLPTTKVKKGYVKLFMEKIVNL
ncbi:hypothetical protein GF357_03180 [Candidatus Dojkabacteria bacterium]|nr:hypothetical protein [Candidatus Dojkabacteria bacterium]